MKAFSKLRDVTRNLSGFANVLLDLLGRIRLVRGPESASGAENSRGLNIFTGVVVAVLGMLSVILTASVLFPEMSAGAIVAILSGGSVLGFLLWGGVAVFVPRQKEAKHE
jgi:hypothetical protein